MLIIALALALIGLVALVFAVVTSNELVAWVCIGASVLGVILLIIDAVRERQQRDSDAGDDSAGEADDSGGEAGDGSETGDDADADETVDYPEEADADEEPAAASDKDAN